MSLSRPRVQLLRVAMEENHASVLVAIQSSRDPGYSVSCRLYFVYMCMCLRRVPVVCFNPNDIPHTYILLDREKKRQQVFVCHCRCPHCGWLMSCMSRPFSYISWAFPGRNIVIQLPDK